jgi:hypothetical protein
MTDKTFKVGGVSNNVGGYKVRFAAEMTRVKCLDKNGADVQLMELPTAMTKSEVVTFLKTTDLYKNPLYVECIDNADAKYNPVAKAPKVVKAKVEKTVKVKADKPSLDALKARKPKNPVNEFVAPAEVVEAAPEAVAE